MDKIDVTKLFFIFPGITFLIYGVHSCFKVYNLKKRGIRTKAKVKDIIDRGLDYGKCPVYEFTAVNGETIIKRGALSSDTLEVNQEIDIIYDSGIPSHFLPADQINYNIKTILSFALGLILVIAGLLT